MRTLERTALSEIAVALDAVSALRAQAETLADAADVIIDGRCSTLERASDTARALYIARHNIAAELARVECQLAILNGQRKRSGL